jgi:hypothetical protein
MCFHPLKYFYPFKCLFISQYCHFPGNLERRNCFFLACLKGTCDSSTSPCSHLFLHFFLRKAMCIWEEFENRHEMLNPKVNKIKFLNILNKHFKTPQWVKQCSSNKCSTESVSSSCLYLVWEVMLKCFVTIYLLLFRFGEANCSAENYHWEDRLFPKGTPCHPCREAPGLVRRRRSERKEPLFWFSWEGLGLVGWVGEVDFVLLIQIVWGALRHRSCPWLYDTRAVDSTRALWEPDKAGTGE